MQYPARKVKQGTVRRISGKKTQSASDIGDEGNRCCHQYLSGRTEWLHGTKRTANGVQPVIVQRGITLASVCGATCFCSDLWEYEKSVLTEADHVARVDVLVVWDLPAELRLCLQPEVVRLELDLRKAHADGTRLAVNTRYELQRRVYDVRRVREVLELGCVE